MQKDQEYAKLTDFNVEQPDVFWTKAAKQDGSDELLKPTSKGKGWKEKC